MSGADTAGQVEAIGGNVTEFRPGDEVFGTYLGAFPEYATTTSSLGMKSVLVRKPQCVTFEQAASTPVDALTALQGSRQRTDQAGAEGLDQRRIRRCGYFRRADRQPVRSSCHWRCSTRNLDLVRSLGADRVIDYTRRDFTTSRERYELLLDCGGNHPLSVCRRVLNSTGILVTVGAPDESGAMDVLGRVFGALVRSRFGRKKSVSSIAKMNKEDLTTVGEFMAAGKVKAVIDS